MSKTHEAHPITRRQLLAGGALLGGGLVAGTAAHGAPGKGRGKNAILNSRRPDAAYDLALAENTLYSTCLQCNTGCGIKCKVQNGVVTKIDGNPYNPWTLVPYLPYETAVDDDPVCLELARVALSPHYEVRTASSVAQCRDELRARKPDLILLDVMITDLGDGLELTRELKANPDTRSIPVIMVTNVNEIYDYRDEIDASYFPHDRWLDKPVKADVLLKTVMDVLDGSGRAASPFDGDTMQATDEGLGQQGEGETHG